MNGNFDFYSTNDNCEGLTTIWEEAEADFKKKEIASALLQYADALYADDWSWETHCEELHNEYKEALDTLLAYGFTERQVDAMVMA